MDDDFYLKADDFFKRCLPTGLTFDTFSLATRYSEIVPREVRLETSLSEAIKLSIPILSSDMDTVTESEMAIAMALCGGIGLIHYNMSNRQQVKEVPGQASRSRTDSKSDHHYRRQADRGHHRVD